MCENMDFRKLKIQELRDFAIKNELNVIGTGKDGIPTRKDFIPVCEEFQEKKRKIETEKIKNLTNMVYGTSNGLTGVYKQEKVFQTRALMRLLSNLMETSYGGEISDENIEYALSEHEKLKKDCIRHGISFGKFEETAQKFRETYSYRIDDHIL
jgi:hypothetical protein